MFTEKQATLCQKTTFYNVIQVFFVEQFKAGLTAKKQVKVLYYQRHDECLL